MLQGRFSPGNILQKDIGPMRKYGRRANEELRGKEADFEVTDISAIAPDRDLRWTRTSDLRRIAPTRITSAETLGEPRTKIARQTRKLSSYLFDHLGVGRIFLIEREKR